jgi:hypothetical protein
MRRVFNYSATSGQPTKSYKTYSAIGRIQTLILGL